MQTVKVELDKSLDSIEIYTLADWHIGDKYCNISEIKDTLNYIKNTPNAYAILNGDLMNNATKQSVSDCYAEEMKPQEQLQTLCDLIEPIKDKVLFITQGNHEARTYKTDGIDLTAIMAKQLGIYDKYAREGGVLFLRFGEDRKHHRRMCYTFYITHGCGSGGKKIGGKANALVERACIVDTDIYVIGHHHTPISTRQSFFRVDTHNSSVAKAEKLFVCTAAKLEYGGYGETFGFTPSSTQTPVILLSGKKKNFIVKV